MDVVKDKYKMLCSKRSDINEHLPTLYNYASKSESILELGVRGVISSYAFIYGLLNNNSSKKKILLNDIVKCNIEDILKETEGLNIEVKYEWINDLELDITENYDLTFIDTWHVYGQLKRELKKFSEVTNKYIIMHDTTVDEYNGETLRTGMNGREQSNATGIPLEEIHKGLMPAVNEFLDNNKDWILKERFTNNNGLTVLEKKV